MSFIPSQWANNQKLFEELSELYFVHQVVNSPFLIKPAVQQEIFKGANIELLLLPKG